MNKVLKLSAYGLCISLWFFTGCSSGDEPEPFDCTASDLDLIANGQNPTSCTANDGTITATASGGKEPYTFAINTGSFGTSATFNNLGGGSFIVRVKDKNNCEKSIELVLMIPGANPLTATISPVEDTECVGNNGSLEVIASGGQPPYQYKIGTGTFSDAAIFSGLAPGNYSIGVKDAAGCVITKGATVGKGDTQTSLAFDVKPIIETKCAITNCHNGSRSPDLTSPSSIISHASQIKGLTQSGAMPKNGSLSPSQKALIACWVDEGAKNN